MQYYKYAIVCFALKHTALNWTTYWCCQQWFCCSGVYCRRGLLFIVGSVRK